jgi:hypothetical protein
VLGTPLVAQMRIPIDPDLPPRPAIVIIADASYTEGPPRTCMAAGVVRLLDGATCRDIEGGAATDPADRVNSPVTPAIGDLDGDMRPEIVAAHADGGVIAFRWDGARLVRMWRARNADGTDDLWGNTTCMWGGVSLYDLNDDGRPEVILDGGSDSAGLRIATVGMGRYPTAFRAIAGVDLDGCPSWSGEDQRGTHLGFAGRQALGCAGSRRSPTSAFRCGG